MRVFAMFLFGLLATASLFLGQQSFGRHSENFVRALHYRVFVLDTIRNIYEGRWTEEIFFPDQKVVCTTFIDRGKRRMHAFFGESRKQDWAPVTASMEEEHYQRRINEEAKKPPEEIRVPLPLAREIFALAALEVLRERESKRLGEVVLEAGILR